MSEDENACAVCGKEAREPVKALEIGIEYPQGEKRNIKIDDFEGSSFCQEHFVRLVALKVEDFRSYKISP